MISGYGRNGLCLQGEVPDNGNYMRISERKTT